jgi:SAM-dependent methyltransferase
MELLLGCGSSRQKKLWVNDKSEWSHLITLDHEPRHKPNLVYDLENIPLPFDDNQFDEVHAYEVLEHVGKQGDWRFFFNQWSDFWRILKPGGYFIGSVPLPTSVWAWGDPSHTRVLPSACFIFLNQPAYGHVGKTAMSDFRSIYKADFNIDLLKEENEQLYFILKAVNPSRISV